MHPWVWQFFKWLPGAITVTLMWCAQVGPKEAASHLSEWASLIGVQRIPSWLETKSADTWGFWIGLAGFVAWATTLWFTKFLRKHRIGDVKTPPLPTAHQRTWQPGKGGIINLDLPKVTPEPVLPVGHKDFGQGLVDLAWHINSYIEHERTYDEVMPNWVMQTQRIVKRLRSDEQLLDGYYTRFSGKVISQYQEAIALGFSDLDLNSIYKNPTTIAQVRMIASHLSALGETIKQRAPTGKEFVPIHKAIAHVADAIDDSEHLDGFRATRDLLRQHANDNKVRVRGRKEIEEPGSTKFSSVEIDIPSNYWKKSVINHLATSRLNKDDHHTNPESVYAWGPEGIFEKKRYASIRVDWSDILRIWPKQ